MTVLTIILGKIIAAYLIVTGLGFFWSNKFYSKMTENADKSDPVLINLSGMVHFLIGIAVVTNHFLWSNFLEIIISGLGFGFLLKGAFLIALPNIILKSNKVTVNKMHIISVIFITAGLIIGYFSYFA